MYQCCCCTLTLRLKIVNTFFVNVNTLISTRRLTNTTEKLNLGFTFTLSLYQRSLSKVQQQNHVHTAHFTWCQRLDGAWEINLFLIILLAFIIQQSGDELYKLYFWKLVKLKKLAEMMPFDLHVFQFPIWLLCNADSSCQDLDDAFFHISDAFFLLVTFASRFHPHHYGQNHLLTNFVKTNFPNLSIFIGLYQN